MKLIRIGSLLTLGLVIGAIQETIASTTFSIGAGTAVTSVDRSAYFNSLAIGSSLAAYTEGLLKVATPDTAYGGFDPFNGNGNGTKFFYPDGGVNDWVTIQTTDSQLMYAVEFLSGNGFVPDSQTFYWETIKSSVVVSSGSIVLNRGAVLGFSDPSGFDQLHISYTSPFGPTINNAVAIDDLNVQLAIVPEPSTFVAGVLLAIPVGIHGVRYMRSRRELRTTD